MWRSLALKVLSLALLAVAGCEAEPDRVEPPADRAPALPLDTGPTSDPPPMAAPTVDHVAPIELDITKPACRAIYVVTNGARLYAFDPRDARFEPVGTVRCPGHELTPFSMAVTSTGHAHILDGDGTLHEVDLATLACRPAVKASPRHRFRLFGMGYARHGAGEALFVADRPPNAPLTELGRIELPSGRYVRVGRLTYSQPMSMIELTATRDGLWGYVTNHSGRGGALLELDTRTGAVKQVRELEAGRDASALALAWWGGRFYIFAHHHQTAVTRYDPRSQTERLVATIADRVVGAGVAPCAPDAEN